MCPPPPMCMLTMPGTAVVVCEGGLKYIKEGIDFNSPLVI